MNNQVLVTYASKYGATIGIAEKIAGVLEEAQFVVSLLPVDQPVNLSSFQAVVLGSPIYVGRWRPEAVSFLENNEKELTSKDVWLFSSGPTGQGDPVDILDGWEFPRQQHDLVNRISPRGIKLFHGAIDLSKLDDLEKNTIKHLKAQVGDFRDWDSIADWAKGIVKTLGESHKVL